MAARWGLQVFTPLSKGQVWEDVELVLQAFLLERDAHRSVGH